MITGFSIEKYKVQKEETIIRKVLDAFMGSEMKDNPIIQTPLELHQQWTFLFRPQISNYLGHRDAMLNSPLHDEIEDEKLWLNETKVQWKERKKQLMAIATECSIDLNYKSCPIVGHFSITDRNEVEPPKKAPVSINEVIQQMVCSLDYLINDLEYAFQLRDNLSADPGWCITVLDTFISSQEDSVKFPVVADMAEHNYLHFTTKRNKHIKYHRELIQANIIYQLSIEYKNNPEDFATKLASTPGCSKDSLWNYLHSKLILETLDPTFGGEIWLKPSWRNRLEEVDKVIQMLFQFLTGPAIGAGKGDAACCIYYALTKCGVAIPEHIKEFIDYFNSKAAEKDKIANQTLSNKKNTTDDARLKLAVGFINSVGFAHVS